MKSNKNQFIFSNCDKFRRTFESFTFVICFKFATNIGARSVVYGIAQMLTSHSNVYLITDKIPSLMVALERELLLGSPHIAGLFVSAWGSASQRGVFCRRQILPVTCLFNSKVYFFDKQDRLHEARTL